MLYRGFELEKDVEIDEIRSRAKLFKHTKTGARLLSITNDDENKVFGISFKTPPKDSTGVAHILEHTVLRGSRKYPVKEPFVELMKGSLNTFLNAFTYPDKTCYPVASQHLQDFYNLIDVYLDCVFYPLLKKDAFETEGWHYELNTPEDPLTYKGIVFNEMKGVFSDPRRIVNYRSMETLLPDTLYALSSGGDPLHIPDLSYEQFIEFHRAYYHPTNSYSYFWGNDPEEHRLVIMDQWFSQFNYVEPKSNISLQQRLETPRSFSFPYPAGDSPEEFSKSRVVVNWMLEQTTDNPTLDLAFLILSHVLVGTQASPLKKALIDSGLGEDLENGIDSEDDLVQKCFSTGLSGVIKDNITRIEPLVLSTLRRLVSEGIDTNTLAASMNTIEFALRERKDFFNTSNLLPPGLFLMVRALGTWIHGGDPIDRLAFERPLQEIKNALTQNPRYFENLIQRHFIENPHRVTVTLTPDSTFSPQRQETESKALTDRKIRMTQEEVRGIVEHTEYLKSLRDIPDPPEHLASIPRIRTADLPRENQRIPSETISGDDGTISVHDVPTNGIVYIDVGFNLGYLSQELIPYVPLFGQALLGMNTDQKTYMQLSQEIGKHTGGIVTETFSKAHVETHEAVSWMFIRGKSLMSQGHELLELLAEMCMKTRFDDKERFRQLVLQRKVELESLLSPKGHHMVYRRLRAMNNEAGLIDEFMNGFEQLFFVRKLLENIESDWSMVLRSLERVRQELIHQQGCVVNITADRVSHDSIRLLAGQWVHRLPSPVREEQVRTFPKLAPQEGFSMPSQVNYVGAVYDLSRVGYQEHGSSLVVQLLLRTTWLWDRVRVRGGAYGGMVLFDRVIGRLYFFSYRDPNLTNTLQIYRQTGEFLEHSSLSQSELDNQIVAAIGEIDDYLLPDEKGFQSLQWFLTGNSDERRQRMRDQIFSTSIDEVREFGSLLTKSYANEHIVVLGSREALVGAQTDLQQTFSVISIL